MKSRLYQPEKKLQQEFLPSGYFDSPSMNETNPKKPKIKKVNLSFLLNKHQKEKDSEKEKNNEQQTENVNDQDTKDQSEAIQSTTNITETPDTESTTINQTKTPDTNTKSPTKEETSDTKSIITNKTETPDINTKLPTKEETSDTKSTNITETPDANTESSTKTETPDTESIITNKTETPDINTKSPTKEETPNTESIITNKTVTPDTNTKSPTKTETSDTESIITNKTETPNTNTKSSTKEETSDTESTTTNKTETPNQSSTTENELLIDYFQRNEFNSNPNKAKLILNNDINKIIFTINSNLKKDIEISIELINYLRNSKQLDEAISYIVQEFYKIVYTEKSMDTTYSLAYILSRVTDLCQIEGKSVKLTFFKEFQSQIPWLFFDKKFSDSTIDIRIMKNLIGLIFNWFSYDAKLVEFITIPIIENVIRNNNLEMFGCFIEAFIESSSLIAFNVCPDKLSNVFRSLVEKLEDYKSDKSPTIHRLKNITKIKIYPLPFSLRYTVIEIQKFSEIQDDTATGDD